MKETLALEAAAKVAAALQEKEKENDHLRNVLRAFGKLRIEQARWKAMLPASNGFDISGFDRERFTKGVPFTDRGRLVCLGDLWPAAAERLLSPMAEGFPKVSRELGLLQNAVLNSPFSLDAFLVACFSGRDEEARAIAAELDIEADILVFALHQLAKPVVENRAASILPLIGELHWNRGYCPICGSFPEMSMLREKEGQRWLLCSFCGTTWRFSRTSCPFCDTQEPEQREIFFVEGREHETAEACHKCKRYLTGIDLRNLANPVVQDILDLSLMHLDAVMLQKGFLPMRGIGWKSIDDSSPDNLH